MIKMEIARVAAVLVGRAASTDANVAWNVNAQWIRAQSMFKFMLTETTQPLSMKFRIYDHPMNAKQLCESFRQKISRICLH
jgi:phosphotransferase system HPr-like phosphotransfer protein